MKKAKIILEKEKNKNLNYEDQEINIEVDHSTKISEIKNTIKENLPIKDIPFYLTDFKNKILKDEQIIGEFFEESIEKKNISIPFDNLFYMISDVEISPSLDHIEISIEEDFSEYSNSIKVKNEIENKTEKKNLSENFNIYHENDKNNFVESESLLHKQKMPLYNLINHSKDKNLNFPCSSYIKKNKEISDLKEPDNISLEKSQFYNINENFPKIQNNFDYQKRIQQPFSIYEKEENRNNIIKNNFIKEELENKQGKILDNFIFNEIEKYNEYKNLELHINDNESNIPQIIQKGKKNTKILKNNKLDINKDIYNQCVNQNLKINESFACRKRGKSDINQSKDFEEKKIFEGVLIKKKKKNISSNLNIKNENKKNQSSLSGRRKISEEIDINKIDNISEHFDSKLDNKFELFKYENNKNKLIRENCFHNKSNIINNQSLDSLKVTYLINNID